MSGKSVETVGFKTLFLYLYKLKIAIFSDCAISKENRPLQSVNFYTKYVTMQKVGIFFGSSTGNTEAVANTLKEKLGEAEVFDVSSVKPEKMAEFANIILGTSTWGVGDLQDDMLEFAEGIAGVDLKGKVVAIFGLGDQSGYGDTYCDGMGELYEKVKGKGCKVVGFVSTEGYDFASSRAADGNEFVGLALDVANQDDLTEGRIDAWVAELKKQFV